jgi:NADPH:quinone reductase-like Zn-dependent oxidoreductase
VKLNAQYYCSYSYLGVVVPLIDSEFEFEKAIDAFDRLMSNKATGKVIIRV